MEFCEEGGAVTGFLGFRMEALEIPQVRARWRKGIEKLYQG
jgi:hypothetical protein